MNRTAAAEAEAAVWVARLHGPARTAAIEREFQDWLAASGEHRNASERCTAVWQDAPRLTAADAYVTCQHRRRNTWPCSVAVVVALGVAGNYFWPTGDTYATAVGEYRPVVLTDGSRLRLNTATRLHVCLSAGQREVDVQAGEALFEVAKDAA